MLFSPKWKKFYVNHFENTNDFSFQNESKIHWGLFLNTTWFFSKLTKSMFFGRKKSMISKVLRFYLSYIFGSNFDFFKMLIKYSSWLLSFFKKRVYLSKDWFVNWAASWRSRGSESSTQQCRQAVFTERGSDTQKQLDWLQLSNCL